MSLDDGSYGYKRRDDHLWILTNSDLGWIAVNRETERIADRPWPVLPKYRDRWWIIDISGNHLRLMAFIGFKHNRMYVRHIVTHAEYDKLTDKYRKESKR